MMRKTRWHYYSSGGNRIRARFGIDYDYARRHSEGPIFEISGEVEQKGRSGDWYQHSSGQMVDNLRHSVPEIAPYLKWHMVGPDGPLQYLSKARHLFEAAQGKGFQGRIKAEPAEAFKRFIRLGAFPKDAMPPEIEDELTAAERAAAYRWAGPKEWRPGAGSRLPWAEVQAWLEARLPDLQAAWAVDMAELEVLEE